MRLQESENKMLWFIVNDDGVIVKVFMSKDNAARYLRMRDEM